MVQTSRRRACECPSLVKITSGEEVDDVRGVTSGDEKRSVGNGLENTQYLRLICEEVK